jgi:demethoxyubiquinone hydroxylase (CLK1/Coq7/Cat5 family)
MVWHCVFHEEWVQTTCDATSYFAGLETSHCQDLADVLPYLACGEISAVYAFSGRLQDGVNAEVKQLLHHIAADERRHAELIMSWQKKLPSPRQVISPSRLAMFFQRLEAGHPSEHLARVSALDRAVCRLLHPLLKRGRALSRAPQLHRDLCALRRDEARHVQLTRRMASDLGCSNERQLLLNTAIQQRLTTLMSPVADALQRMGGA